VHVWSLRSRLLHALLYQLHLRNDGIPLLDEGTSLLRGVRVVSLRE